MKKIFLDTNVIIDFLGDRRPFSKFAFDIFKKGFDGEVELWTSTNSITTVYYILQKLSSEKRSRDLISLLLGQIRVQAITQEHLLLASKSKFTDFEDGVQHYCAISIIGMAAIITRNKKDFSESNLNILAPDEFLQSKLK
jgi:predicted nucleic acid-binding protein